MKTLSLLFIFLAAACGGEDRFASGTSEAILMDDSYEMVEEEDFLGKKDVSWTPSNSSGQNKGKQETFQQKIIKTGNLSYK